MLLNTLSVSLVSACTVLLTKSQVQSQKVYGKYGTFEPFPDHTYPGPLPLNDTAEVTIGFYLDDEKNNTIPHPYVLNGILPVNISWAISDASRISRTNGILEIKPELDISPNGFEALADWLGRPDIALLLPPRDAASAADLKY